MSIIAINGLPGSGKDTVGRMLQFLTSDYGEYTYEDYLHYIHHTLYSENPKYKIKKIATPLKQCAAIILGCNVEDFESQKFKKSVLDEKWWCFERRHGSKTPYTKDSKLNDLDLVKPTIREFLQKLGTEVGRTLHPNTWVNSLTDEYDKRDWLSNWIITDLRYMNEYEVLKSIEPNLIVIKIIGRGKDNGHSSNHGMDNHKFDYTIYNTGSLEELFREVKFLKDYLSVKNVKQKK